jgi:MFS family permease
VGRASTEDFQFAFLSILKKASAQTIKMHHTDKSAVTGVAGVTLQDVLPKRDKMWWNYPKLLKLNLLLMCAIISDITNGYDQSMLNGLQIIPGWRKYFGTPTGQRLGTISNGVRFGQIGALFVIAPLIQRYGRRVPIAIGSVILLVGVVLQTTAQNYGMFVVGRILIGFGNNIQQTTCPVLLAELTYPDQRPKIVGITNTTGSLGQLIAAVSKFPFLADALNSQRIFTH